MIDLCIVGAGPTGLLMAIEAHRHGLSCKIIDKDSAASDKSKALAIQARTLEILNYSNLTEQCLEEGLKVFYVSATSQGKKLINLSFHEIESEYAFVLSLEQSKFEQILLKKLKNLGIEVEREVELSHFSQENGQVSLALKDKKGEKQVKARWLAGCDGAHSSVRKQLGFEFEGLSFPEILSLADVEINWKYPQEYLRGFLEKEGVLFAIPLKDKNRFRVIFQLERGKNFLKNNKKLAHGKISAASLKSPTWEEVCAALKKFADPQASIGKVFWLTNFSINSRMVKQYYHENIFLLGDAAHIHSPVGGQGMNTGLQDAFNLAWKLSLVKKNFAGNALLESYHEERHFVGKNLLHNTERATHFIFLQNKFLFYIRNFFVSCLLSFKKIQKKVVNTLSQISICYPKSRWIMQSGEAKISAGKRAPDASIIIDGKNSTLFSLLQNSRSFHLLFIDLEAQSLNIEGQIRDLIEPFKAFISLQPIRNTQKERGIKSDHTEIKKLFGDGLLYLIRPDGYIAYCGPIDAINALKKYLEVFNKA